MNAANTGAWQTGLVLISDLASVIRQLATFVLRASDVDADREELASPAEEHRLGSRMVDLGTELQARASRRSATVRAPGIERSIVARPCETPRPWTNPDSAIYTIQR